MKDPIRFLRQQFPPTSDEAWGAVLTKDLKGADWREVLRWSSDEGFDLLPFYRHQKRGDERANSQANHDDQTDPDGQTDHFDQTNHFDQTSQCEWVDEIHPADPLAQWFSRYGLTDGSESRTKFIVKDESSVESSTDPAPILDSLLTDDSIEIDATAYHEAGATLVQELAATLGTLNEILLHIASTDVAPSSSSSPTSSPNPTSSPKADRENEHSPPRPITIYLSAGSLYFPEIAKFKTCRTLIHGLLALHFPDAHSTQPSSPDAQSAQPSSPHPSSPHPASPNTASTHPSPTSPASSLSPPIILHAVTSTRNKSRKDIHDNLIRLTTESMAAILGGADRITIHPPDFIETRDTNGASDSSSPDSSSSSSSSPSSSFSQRMARNIHHLLTLESHLGNVSNPTAGCYYLEELHDQLARKAWEQFQEWERQGGFLHGLMQGHVGREIRQARTNRLKDLAEGKTQRIDTETYLEEQR